MEVAEASWVALSVVFVSIIARCAWSVLDWVWLKPKKLESCLREQGLQGNSYRFLYGDMKQSSIMLKQAKSKPLNLSSSHDIAPLLEHEDFQKPVSNPFIKLLIRGLASYEGEKWVKQRRIINPAFHLEKQKLMIPAFHQCLDELIKDWESSVLKVGSSAELDVWFSLQNMTADAISRTAFGTSYQEGRKIFELQQELAVHVAKSTRSVYIPGWRFLPTKMKEIYKEIKGIVKGMIKKREQAMKVGEASKNDLLGALLESSLKDIQDHDGKNNKNVGMMSIDEVVHECKLFYFAGQETTAVLLVWTIVLLGQNQNWQDRARQEVLQVLGSKKPDFNALTDLKVVTMILLEVLRLYPPIIKVHRTNMKKTQLGKYWIPAGVELNLPILLIHHDKDLWGDDAKELKPDRFAEGVSKATKRQLSFFPLGGGPRICIGQNFAMTEAKLALAVILQKFTFELSPSYVHAPCHHITLQPQYGAPIILHRR